MSPRSLVIPALAALAACSAQTPPAESTPATPPAASDEPSCGAEKLSSYVGKKATDDVIAAIRASRGDAPMRVIKPGMAVTMDYRAERLNVDVDESGTIKRLHCS